MRRALIAAVVTFSVGLPAALHALDPKRATSQYVVTKWGARDLSSSSVHALSQTRDHYLWLATTGGLVRFDGARFSFFGAPDTPGIPEGGASSLAEGPDGTLYIGTSAGGVVQYKGGAFSPVAVQEAAGAVHGMLPRADGSLWLVVHGRPAYRYTDGQSKSVGTSKNVDGPLAIAEDAAGHVFIGTGRDGLVHFEGEEAVPDARVKDAIQALYFDRHGVLWLGTPHGLVRIEGDKIERFSTREGLSHEYVSAILEDRDGNLWIGTGGGGLNRFSNGRFTQFTTREGLSNDHVRCLLEDHEGNLWVGTADGLDCLSDGRFITYGRLEGLRDPVVTAMAGTRDGSVWMGTNTAGLARLRDGRIEHFDFPAGFGRDAIITLHEGRDGGLWVVVDNGRVFHIKDGKVAERTPAYADAFQKVRVVEEDEKGPLFFIPRLGPARTQGRKLLPLIEPPPRWGYFHGAYRDVHDTLWLCASMGLVRLGEGEPKVYRQADGLPHDRVRWLTGNPDGSLWIATIGGLGYLKDGVFRKVTVAEGLPENYLRLVLDDGLGYLWIASMSRIFRVSQQEVFDLFAGKRPRLAPITFDTWDGLRATEGGALSNSPGFRAADGRLWFATAQGASVVDPSRISVEEKAPRVIIEGVTVDGRHTIEAEYPPGRGEVTIDFTALAFRSPGKLRFRHRLEGLDQDWVDASTRRTAYYSNLFPGHYRFAVMASNRDGVWNGEATFLELTIRPPFYRRTSFYLGCALLVLGIAAIVHRVRVRAMHARLTAIIHERTRIARELHDTLAQGLAGVGIQLDTTMTILPETPTLDRVRRQLEQAHSMIRTSLAEVRRSIWVLRAQTAKDAKDLVSSLSDSLGQLTGESGTRSTFEVTGDPRPLSPDLERTLLRIAHEAVTNALRHSGGQTIAVNLHFDRDHVRLRVKDDGRGFDPESALRRTSGAHFGLVGISERTRSLGGELSLASRPDGGGAEIDCRLPYHHTPVVATDVVDGASL
jgi:signal transduction histidine kinase/ligand-binding sensor domain-containing protein